MSPSADREATVLFPRKAAPKQRPRIGLLLSNLVDEYQAAVLQGAHETARARGAHLLCFVGGPLGSPRRRAAERSRVYDLVGRSNVDALAIVAGSVACDCGPAPLAEFCKRFGDMPLCTIAGDLPGAARIVIDNQAGMSEAVAHLIEEHGRRGIAFVRGPETNQEAEQRFEAYRRALAEHRIPVEARMIAPGDFSAESGARAVELFFDERKLHGVIDAIVAADDVTAIGVLGALEARKIDVPSQVAVTGFDDLEESRFCSRPLTTVRQPIREQGAAAVRLLFNRLEGSVTEERIELTTTTVIRRSCGCFSASSSSTRDSRAPGTRSSFEAELIRRRQIMTAELSRAAQGSLTGMPGWNDLLVKSFTDQVQTQSDRFSKAFRSLLSSLLSGGADVSAVHDVITVLRRQMLGCLDPDPVLRDRAENMFQEVRLVTSEAMERVQSSRRARAERIACTLAATSSELAVVDSVADLRSVVSKRFAELGITSCYVSLFEDGPEPDGSSRPLVAYDLEAARPDSTSGTFPTAMIAPESWLGADRSRSYVVMVVHLDGEPLGIMAVSLEAPAYVYDALGDVMGVAIDRLRRIASTPAPKEAASMR
jgi:DNA-binding LacI/PurR family transcriptional regulator